MLSRLTGFLGSLTTAEWVVLGAIFLNQFTYWPNVEVSGNTIEPGVFSSVVIVVYAALKWLKPVLAELKRSRAWQVILLIWLYGASLGLLLTDDRPQLFIDAIYLLVIILAAVSIGVFYAHKQLNVGRLFTAWVLLALIMLPAYVIQYLSSAFGSDYLIRQVYHVGTFQFPRLHGFSLEPLFLGNWLLVPATYSFIQLQRTKRVWWFVAASLISFSLFLTLGRGAIYAWVTAVGVYLLITRFKNVINLAGAALVGLVLALGLVGFSASQNDSSFKNGVGRYLDHASQGVFNSEGASNVMPTEVTVTPTDSAPITQTNVESFVITTELDTEGVVEASTKGRIEAVKAGFEVFSDSTRNSVFGVGLFRFGEEANKLRPEVFASDNQVTNSQPVDYLAETGMVGVGLALLVVAFGYKNALKTDLMVKIAFLAICLQYLFFTSYFLLPFWLCLGLLLVSKSTLKERKS